MRLAAAGSAGRGIHRRCGRPAVALPVRGCHPRSGCRRRPPRTPARSEGRCRRCRRGRDRPARACRRPRRPSRPDRRRSGTTSLRRCRRSGSPGSVSGSSIQPSNALPTSTASFACSCILKGSARIGRIPSLAGAGVTGRSLHRSLGVHPLVTGEAGGWPAHRSLLLIRVLDRLQEPPSTERLLLSRSCGQGSGHRPRALAAGIVSPGHQDHTGSRRDRG